MAKGKRAVAARPPQKKQIQRLLILDAFRSGVVTAIAIGAAFVVWVLSNAELIPMHTAVTVVTGLVLFAVLHMSLRSFISEHTSLGRGAAVALFAVVWMAAIFYPIYQVTNPAPPLFTTDLHPQTQPATVPLHGAAGSYRLTVEGHFPADSERANHSAHYRLHVGDGADVDQVLEGDFTESWRRQRLGRRGGVPVQVGHTLSQHSVTSNSGRDLSVELTDLGAGIGNAVHVALYPDTFSTTLYAALGVALTLAALVIDAWRGVDPGDGVVTMGTLSAIVGVMTLRAFASTRVGFGDIGVNAVLGMLVGVPSAAVLWRLARGRLRHLVGSSD